MSETLALLRLTLRNSRFLLSGIVIALTIEVIALAAAPDNADSWRGIPIVALLFTALPAAFAAIVLFDYGDNGDMNLPESGCSHWLLRMPIDSWKIALVPVVLRTLWITSMWALFVFTAGYLDSDDTIPLAAPAIVFSAASIWVLIIAWRPFRSGWRRLVALLLTLPLLYLCAAAVLVAPSIKQVPWRTVATNTSFGAAVALYAIAVWLAIRTVRLARTNAVGIIPEFGKGIAGSRPGEHDKVRRFRSPVHALAWHDLQRSRLWIRGTLIAGVVPAVAIISLFKPLNGPNVVLVLIVFAYLAWLSICRFGFVFDALAPLPPYLAASPLSSAKIAWARSLLPLAIAGGVFFCVLFAFAGWSLSMQNRDVWMRWAAEQAESLNQGDRAIEVGIRWSIAIVLASAILMLGRVTSLMWIGMTGRPWVINLMAWVSSLGFLLPLGIALRWFIVQTDWESTRASAIGYLSYAPYVVAGLLAAKTFAVIGSVVALTRIKLVSAGTTLQVVSIWVVATLLISLTLFLLIPDRRATFLWCLALTTLTIPLARILVQPLALDWNRHR